MVKSNDNKIKKPKKRSPNYPVVSLVKAVDLVGKLNDEYGTHEVPINLAHRLWSYKEYGGAGNQCVAALKSFGLINVFGTGKDRKIRVTDKAHRIHKKAPDWAEILKESALLPVVHKEIWEHYEGNVPKEELLKNYLVWEYQPPFNEKSVSGFISEFQETISYAKLKPDDIIKPIGENDSSKAVPPVGDKKTPVRINKLTPPEEAKLPKGDQNMATDTFTLEEGEVILQYPQKLSQPSYEDLKDWTELQLRKIQRSINKANKENEKAVEKKKEIDDIKEGMNKKP